MNIRKKSHDDLPATVRLVKEVRSELRAETRALGSKMDGKFKKVDGRFNEMESRFKKIDARFNEVDARFNRVDARFADIDARFDKVDARFAEVDARFDKVDGRFNDMDSNFQLLRADVHRTMVLMEEQRAENRIVLDGLKVVIDRQERIEQEHAHTRRLVDAIVPKANN